MSTNINDIVETFQDENNGNVKSGQTSSWCSSFYPYKSYLFIFLASFIVLKFLTEETITLNLPHQLLVLGPESIYSVLISLLVYIAQEHIFKK